jgi:hypothetical protein
LKRVEHLSRYDMGDDGITEEDLSKLEERCKQLKIDFVEVVDEHEGQSREITARARIAGSLRSSVPSTSAVVSTAITGRSTGGRTRRRSPGRTKSGKGGGRAKGRWE